MEPITAFKTSDGEVFMTEKEALFHEKLCEMREWYEDHMLYGGVLGCRIEWDDLVDWLQDNRDEVKTILAVC